MVADRRLISSHAFVTVTRLRAIAQMSSTIGASSSLLPLLDLAREKRERRRERERAFGPFIFFSPTALRRRRRRRRARARARGRCRRSHDLRYFPPGHFPRSRSLLAPSAGPLSYFPPGNIAPTRKTIRLEERRPLRRGRPRGDRREVLSRNNICICERLSPLLISRTGRFYLS